MGSNMGVPRVNQVSGPASQRRPLDDLTAPQIVALFKASGIPLNQDDPRLDAMGDYLRKVYLSIAGLFTTASSDDVFGRTAAFNKLLYWNDQGKPRIQLTLSLKPLDPNQPFCDIRIDSPNPFVLGKPMREDFSHLWKKGECTLIVRIADTDELTFHRGVAAAFAECSWRVYMESELFMGIQTR